MKSTAGRAATAMVVASVFIALAILPGHQRISSHVIPFVYSTLIFAGVLDFAVFGDKPDAAGLVGALIIVLGAVFLALREHSRPSGQPKPGNRDQV